MLLRAELEYILLINRMNNKVSTTHRIQLINQIPGESACHLVLNLIMEKILLQNGLVPKIASYGRIAATKVE